MMGFDLAGLGATITVVMSQEGLDHYAVGMKDPEGKYRPPRTHRKLHDGVDVVGPEGSNDHRVRLNLARSTAQQDFHGDRWRRAPRGNRA
jgi:hypothetical protein